jgi:transposase-like protein
MDIKEQAITEYLTKGTGYRKLGVKYGVSRSTINKWVLVHQCIHNILPTTNQQKYYLSGMNSKPEQQSTDEFKELQALQQKIALLEKQLAWEKLRADALDTMINIAEKQLDISIRKKSGNQQS